jgi:hypothetical protein
VLRAKAACGRNGVLQLPTRSILNPAWGTVRMNVCVWYGFVQWLAHRFHRPSTLARFSGHLILAYYY